GVFCAVLSVTANFFFQAEDGIRDFHVTGVQTCALPISSVARSWVYWVMRAFSGSVRMRRKSSSVRERSSTRMGNRPCSSGIRSEGLETRSEEHTSELQSRENLVCRLLLEQKKQCSSGCRTRPPTAD